MRLMYTSNAKADIQEITAYIALDDTEKAHLFARELYGFCESLVLFPSKYPLLKERVSHIRRATCGNYNVYYTVNTQTVLILRILHSARNIFSLL